MKKSTTLFFAALLASVPTLAQTTIRVQGAPRKLSNAVATRLMKAADATQSTAIDFSKIERWTGSGDCRAALAIKWADGQNEGKTLVWGYRWNSGDAKTGEDLIRAVAKADPALYLMADPKNPYGFTIGGMGYDTDADRLVSVTTMEAELYPRNGIVTLTSDSYETSAATDWGDGDAWNSGWTSGFWSYYIADNAADGLLMAQTGCSGRELKDGCVDAYVFGYFDTEHEANAYDGNVEYLPATTDYTSGAFIVNEDWFGHQNSTANYLAADGQFVYNNTTDLGCTACFGAAWGNRYYIISKMAKDAGAEKEGGRISICDANTMRVIKQIADIDGKEGRSFCGIDEHKGYVSTSGGIYSLDLDNMTVGSDVKNADGGDASLGQCGNMVLSGGYVYAVEYGGKLHVIDPTTDRIVASIDGSVYSITLAHDGSLWVSTADGIARVNTATRTLEAVQMAEGIGAPANSPWAWTADGLCASYKRNVIYWTAASGWNTTSVFGYDIDTNEWGKVVDLSTDADGWKMYSTSNMRVSPVSEELLVSMFKDWGSTDYAVRRYAADGTLLAQYDLEQKNYWFPGMFVFPDTEDPTVSDIDDINVSEGGTATVSLDNVVSDADNLQAAITKSIGGVSDESVATARIEEDGTLIVEGLKEGTTTISLKFCSNGITATKDIDVSVAPATGINATTNGTGSVSEVARYTTDGKRIGKPQQGVNIVRYSDGSTRKVVVD